MPSLSKTIREENAQKELEERERLDREREEAVRKVQAEEDSRREESKREAVRIREERAAERKTKKDAVLKEAYDRFKAKKITADELQAAHSRILDTFDAEEERDEDAVEETLKETAEEDIRMQSPSAEVVTNAGEKRKRVDSGGKGDSSAKKVH
jgi:hypothetical protein